VECSTGSTASDVSTANLDRGITSADTEAAADEPGADLAEFAEWSADQTAREHLNRSAVLGLAELIGHTAEFFRRWPTQAGALISETLDDLAAKVAATGATTPTEYRDRIGVLADEAREQWESVGFENGLAQARAECARRHSDRSRSVFEGGPDD
jgi:hypothetical protein